MTINPKGLLLRVIDEAVNQGKMEVLDEAVAEDMVHHDLVNADLIGRDQYRQYLLTSRKEFPDFHMTIDSVIQEGEMFALQLHWEGTHLGESQNLNIPATGKHILVKGCTIVRMKDGKAVEQWYYLDRLGMMRQLGLLPQSAKA